LQSHGEGRRSGYTNAGAVRAIGSERELHPVSFGTDGLVPSLHLASWNFTGGAKG